MTTDFRSVVSVAPTSAGIFLDFDGTLSRIVEMPADARPVEGAREVLSELSERIGVVALVSGRSASHLLEWMGSEIEIWGVHGAERVVDGRVELSEAAAPFRELMTRLHGELTARTAGLEGVAVEDKAVVIGLHYRNAPVEEVARNALEKLAGEVAREHDLEVSRGRMVIELSAPVEFSKADVVRRRAGELQLRAAAFVGDDTVDLPAFDALDELRASGVATARIAVRSDESPEELLRRADDIVDAPEGAVAWLRSLL